METLAVRKKGRNFGEKYAFLASGQIIISCNIPNDGKNVKTDFSHGLSPEKQDLFMIFSII